MNTLKVKPKNKNTIVRMPEKNNQVLPINGDEVPNNSYWQRRLNDGDIETVTKIKKITATATKPNIDSE